MCWSIHWSPRNTLKGKRSGSIRANGVGSEPLEPVMQPAALVLSLESGEGSVNAVMGFRNARAGSVMQGVVERRAALNKPHISCSSAWEPLSPGGWMGGWGGEGGIVKAITTKQTNLIHQSSSWSVGRLFVHLWSYLEMKRERDCSRASCSVNANMLTIAVSTVSLPC